MDEDTAVEELVKALGMALIRKGLLDSDDIADAAERAELSGSKHGLTVAHLLAGILVHAQTPEQSDSEAEERRKQMRLVPRDNT